MRPHDVAAIDTTMRQLQKAMRQFMLAVLEL